MEPCLFREEMWRVTERARLERLAAQRAEVEPPRHASRLLSIIRSVAGGGATQPGEVHTPHGAPRDVAALAAMRALPGHHRMSR